MPVSLRMNKKSSIPCTVSHIYLASLLIFVNIVVHKEYLNVLLFVPPLWGLITSCNSILTQWATIVLPLTGHGKVHRSPLRELLRFYKPQWIKGSKKWRRRKIFRHVGRGDASSVFSLKNKD